MRASELPEAAVLLAAVPPVARLVRRLEVAETWGQPSDLPGYTVGAVAGHLVRAVRRVASTLDGPAPDGPLATLDEWYLANRVATPDDHEEALARWLRDDGAQLAQHAPEALSAELESGGDRLATRLAEEDADRTVAVVRTDKAVPLRDYLLTRLIEVVVHADDIAVGAGIATPAFDPAVMDAASSFLVKLARARSGDLAVVRALTREQRVADPYDVLRVL